MPAGSIFSEWALSIKRSPFLPVLDEIHEAISGVAQPGDVLFRLGNAKAFFVIPFSSLVAGVSRSHYSHASIIRGKTEIAKDIYDLVIYEVLATGTSIQMLTEWLINCAGPRIGLFRWRKEYQKLVPEMLALADRICRAYVPYANRFKLEEDPVTGLPKSLYCTQFVYYLAKKAGIPIDDALVKVRDLPAFPLSDKRLIGILNSLGISLDQEIVTVGNEQIGLMASKALEKVAEWEVRPSKEIVKV
jgi:hypothetical protein